jgi:glycosyltransferase involved in cell wall biosynthesis
MPNPPLITIFTPTYNRAHTLHRVFDSLCGQTLRDFEWLVIDDGSTDNTEELVAGWAQSADFPVRYLRQDHAGKHIAYNRALIETRGRFFTCLDSDDALMPDALEKLVGLWKTIPDGERHAFCSVGGLCCDQNGKIIGDRFPIEPFDADLRELVYVHRNLSEKWSMGLTEILRRFPFPEIAGTQFIPEGMIGFEAAKTFKHRWFNEIVRVYYVNDAETGATLSERASFRHNALGRWHYYIWMLNNNLEYFFHSPTPFLKAATMVSTVGWFSGQKVRHALTALKSRRAKLLVLSALPLSALLYALDRADPVRTHRQFK